MYVRIARSVSVVDLRVLAIVFIGVCFADGVTFSEQILVFYVGIDAQDRDKAVRPFRTCLGVRRYLLNEV